MSKISIVVPVLNEETNIDPLFAAIESVLSKTKHQFEVLFIDDGSTDDTRHVVKRLNQRDQRVKLISFSRNFGHQVALTAGMDNASGDAVIMMDADLQHPPSLLLEMLKEWEKGHDVVYTVRSDEKSAKLSKSLSSRFFYLLFRLFSDTKIPYGVADFRLLDRKVLVAFADIRERNRFLRGLTFWVGFKRKEIEYVASERHSGVTKYSWRKMMNFAIEGITSFSTVPLIASIFFGFAVAGMGLGYGGYVVYAKFFTNWTVPGWSSIMIFTSTIGGLQLILLGVVGVYIGKIYEETKQRPIYIVQEAIGLIPK